MRWKSWDEPEIVEHRDEAEVRLHQGSRHGEVIALPDQARRRARVFAIPKVDVWFPVASEPEPLPEPEQYVRHKFAFYDEVDHVMHTYDYWLIAGGRLPKVR